MEPVNPYQPPSAAVPAPAALQPGTSLDFARCLTFVFKDPKWVQKVLLGSLFVILGTFLIGSIFMLGYVMRLIRNVARGDAYPLPEWDDFGTMFVDGLQAFGMYLVYIIPPAVAFVALAVALGVSAEDKGLGAIAAITGSVALMLVLSVAVLVILFFVPAAFTRLALEKRFTAAFELEEIASFIKRNIVNYLLALAVYLVSSFASSLGFILFCIGIIPASFWQMCVTGYALGEVALRDPTARG